MELEGGSLPESQRLHVQDLDWSSYLCGIPNSPGGPGLGHDSRCEVEEARKSSIFPFVLRPVEPSGGTPLTRIAVTVDNLLYIYKNIQSRSNLKPYAQ